MRVGLRASALLLAPLVLAGCGALGGTAASSIPPIPPIPPAPSMSVAPVPSAASGSADGVAGTCDPSVSAAVDGVVSAQLAAFKARDFDAAFALAAEQFRAITDAAGLKALILKGHPEVADSVWHEFTDCRQPNSDLVLAAVSVTGENGKTVLLVYQFTLENGTWHILQSAPMSGHGGGGSGGGSAPSPSGDV